MNRIPLRVVITGASSGIGAATAIAFAGQGAHLVLGARGRAGLENVARRCRAAGGMAEVQVVDVTDADAVAAFARKARSLLGGIDLWFSNVGIGAVGKYVDVPLEDHRQVIEANLIGHMNDAHAVLPIFLEQDYGTWVNMISLGGYIPAPFAAAYAASKFGLRGFSAALRGELRRHRRIHVCDVYPTFVDTPGFEHAANYTGAKLSYPPGVLAPEKVAAAVVELARRPRATTVVGMPSPLLRLMEAATPVNAALMNRFLESWSKRAERVPDTAGALYAPPRGASGVHSGGDGGGTVYDKGDSKGNGLLASTPPAMAALALGAAVAAAAFGMRLARKP